MCLTHWWHNKLTYSFVWIVFRKQSVHIIRGLSREKPCACQMGDQIEVLPTWGWKQRSNFHIEDLLSLHFTHSTLLGLVVSTTRGACSWIKNKWTGLDPNLAKLDHDIVDFLVWHCRKVWITKIKRPHERQKSPFKYIWQHTQCAKCGNTCQTTPDE